jgi:hypothetical protein
VSDRFCRRLVAAASAAPITELLDRERLACSVERFHLLEEYHWQGRIFVCDALIYVMRARNPYTQRKLEEDRKLPPRSGPLAVANVGFHETYTRFVEQILAQLGERFPVFVLIGNDLALLCDGKTQREEVIPGRYHKLKALAHLAFGVQLTLIANGSGRLADVTASELQLKRTQIVNAQAAANVLVEAAASQAPVDLLRHALALVEQVLAAGIVELKGLRDEIRGLASRAVEAGRLAVCIELEQLHGVVERWRSHLGEARWADLYVVICGNHQPRYREAASQYFARLLHRPEGFAAEREERWLYGEGLDDIDAALDLLARHIVDQRASRLLFGDRCHLQKDLLADAATAELKKLLPPQRRR